MGDYTSFSTRINNIYRQYSDLTEAYSIDESFLDVTYVLGLFGPPLEIARQIQKRVRSEIGVGINIGIGPSKLVAKMAAELEKHNKIIPLSLEEWPQRIWPLPAQELFGVGHRIGRWLRSYAINTIGDLAALPVERLTRRYSVIGVILHYSANGLDFSPVDPGAMCQRHLKIDPYWQFKIDPPMVSCKVYGIETGKSPPFALIKSTGFRIRKYRHNEPPAHVPLYIRIG